MEQQQYPQSPKFTLLDLGFCLYILVGGMIGGAVFHDSFKWSARSVVGFSAGIVAAFTLFVGLQCGLWVSSALYRRVKSHRRS